jgi:hypothetical protein
MLIEWLEPSLEKSIDRVTESCIESDKFIEINKKFMVIINELNDSFSIGSKLPELENLFWSVNALSIDYAYRESFRDAMNLFCSNKS